MEQQIQAVKGKQRDWMNKVMSRPVIWPAYFIILDRLIKGQDNITHYDNYQLILQNNEFFGRM
jgi:hypothetical protein